MDTKTDGAIHIRDFLPHDRQRVDDVVRTAWLELSGVLPGWNELETRLGALTAKAAESEVIVAEMDAQIVGAAGYAGAHPPRWGGIPRAPRHAAHGRGAETLQKSGVPAVARTARHTRRALRADDQGFALLGKLMTGPSGDGHSDKCWNSNVFAGCREPRG
jgi:hypothetical protein